MKMNHKFLSILILYCYSFCGVSALEAYNFGPSFCPVGSYSFCNFTSKYRTFNGTCNNIERPWTGQANSTYKHYIWPAMYADNKSAPRNASLVNKNSLLPDPRSISRQMCNENNATNNRWTYLLTIFGQFVTHDITSLQTTSGIIIWPFLYDTKRMISHSLYINDSRFLPMY